MLTTGKQNWNCVSVSSQEYKMKIFSIRINKLLFDIFILFIFNMVITLFYSGCESLPSQSDGPDNPLDPNNPNNKIQGPALILSPTDIKINTGDEFQLELWIVEADSVAGMSTRIIFDPIEFSVKSVDSLDVNSESFFLQNGGQLIWFCTINNDDGYVQIDCAVVEGSPRNVYGSGVISKIVFQNLSGTETEIDISNQSSLRDAKNQTHTIGERIGAQVNIN